MNFLKTLTDYLTENSVRFTGEDVDDLNMFIYPEDDFDLGYLEIHDKNNKTIKVPLKSIMGEISFNRFLDAGEYMSCGYVVIDESNEIYDVGINIYWSEEIGKIVIEYSNGRENIVIDADEIVKYEFIKN